MEEYEDLKLKADIVKTTIMQLQNDLDQLVKATESLADSQKLPIRFFNKVNVGKTVESFSEMCRNIFAMEENLKTAIEEEKQKKTLGVSDES